MLKESQDIEINGHALDNEKNHDIQSLSSWEDTVDKINEIPFIDLQNRKREAKELRKIEDR